MHNGDIKILLVDNHQMMRQGLRQLISARPGLTVVGEAFSIPSALELLPTVTPQLVLLNTPLPGIGGMDLIRRILAGFPPVKVVVLSGDAELELVLQLLHAGVAGYVLKENDSEELFRAIHAVMVFQLYLSPAVAALVIRDFMKHHGIRKPARPGLDLSEREQWLLQLVAGGKRNKEIAGEMTLAIKSVETYRSRLMKKLGCDSTAELIRYAIRKNIIQA
jgi:DNA-binding NarL/FixJ family response regulator